MATLPPTDVTVVESPQTEAGRKSYAVTARRGGVERTWSGEAGTDTGAIKEVVEKMLNDPRTGEFVKR